MFSTNTLVYAACLAGLTFFALSAAWRLIHAQPGTLQTFMQKKLIATVLVMACIANGFAQNSRIEALRQRLGQKLTDTAQVNVLNLLSDEYRVTGKHDSALHYAQVALDRATQTGYTSGVGAAYNNFRGVHYNKGNNQLAMKYAQDALWAYEKAGNKRGLTSVIGNIGNIYLQYGDYPKALDHYSRALKLAQELKDKTKMAVNLGNMAIVYKNQSSYAQALEHYLGALKIDEELGNTKGMANHLSGIGNIYWNQREFAKALEYHNRALKLSEAMGNKRAISTHLGNIGLVYFDQATEASLRKDNGTAAALNKKALEHYTRAVKIDEELGDKTSLAIDLGNIGNVYQEER